MDQTFKIGQTYYPKQSVGTTKKLNGDYQVESNKFNAILQEKINSVDLKEIKFSIHAKQRLDSRGIKLDNQAIDQLNHAVQRAAQKGAKDSLILMKDLAFVVNVPNRVVITTVDEASMKEHIFTNIDSAIII